MIVLRMPWTSPPLRSNDRLHWAVKAKITKEIRTIAHAETAKWIDLGKQFPELERLPGGWLPKPPVIVSLIWEVTDKRRRDVGASGPTLKAAIDGMVDAGLLPFDHHDIVTEERLRIEYGPTKGVRIEIESSRIAEVIPQLTEGQQ